MNRKTYIDRIAILFARFRAEVETLNKAGLYDINIHSETVIIPILNLIYDLELVNVNFEEKNSAAVDLVDKNNRTAFQVTSTADGEKVKATLDKFIKHEKYLDFDILSMFILTTKQTRYSDDVFKQILGEKIVFNSSKNILDASDLMREINSILSVSKIQGILDVLEREFTEEKIAQRHFFSENKETLITEIVYPNILEIQIPGKVYVANLNLNRDEVIAKSWETEWKLKRSASDYAVVVRALAFQGFKNIFGWHVFENKIISFKPFIEKSQPLNKIVEIATIEAYEINDFSSINFKYEAAVLQLIDKSIQDLLWHKQIFWFQKDRVFRFMPPREVLGERQISWKNKKNSTRTVVKEVWNTEKTQISYYRQLAFKVQSFKSDEHFYVSISPTWSFTYNGYKNHFYESDLITNMKKLEVNNAVYLHFMFIAYCLKHKIVDEEPDYDFIKVFSPFDLTLTLS